VKWQKNNATVVEVDKYDYNNMNDKCNFCPSSQVTCQLSADEFTETQLSDITQSHDRRTELWTTCQRMLHSSALQGRIKASTGPGAVPNAGPLHTYNQHIKIFYSH